ncbi:uncharacterized protein LOC123523371 isoform X2 [Mercenaria mercenaria]|uniref:uncharacterized protein LOC123523371 isoform X2 n=1 Tax=Mercenaria mercenaria TaxID=6596 RepID=UPI00234EDB91|nr:uncharacterized protein LOC123523371 isoform X2 [Mercenaria mercenaria]
MHQKTAVKTYIIPLVVYTYMCTFLQSAEGNDDWHFYGENIAFHKTANQLPETFFDHLTSAYSVAFDKYYPASLAVDGNTDSYFKHGSCSHTTGKSIVDASWTVDLGKPFNITGIVIYNRDEVKIRLKNFQIYGDDTTLIHNSAGTDEYNKNILTFKLDGLRSFSTITILLPKQHGHSDGGNYYLTLCEVQIYAAPRPACDVSLTDVTNGEAQIFNYTGRLINHKYTVGTIIEVHCKEKFHPDVLTRFECLASGKYNYTVPKCLDSLCIIPNITNGKFINVLSTKFDVGTTLQFICDKGFTAAASEDTITCEKNFQWNITPVCQDSLCIIPNITNGKFINVLSTKFDVGTTLQFICDKGFTAAASEDTITCEKNFQWNITPVCQAVSDTSSRHTIVIIVVVVVAFVFVITLVLVIFIYRRRQRQQKDPAPDALYTVSTPAKLRRSGEVPGTRMT